MKKKKRQTTESDPQTDIDLKIGNGVNRGRRNLLEIVDTPSKPKKARGRGRGRGQRKDDDVRTIILQLTLQVESFT